MYLQSKEEYIKAYRAAQKEYKERTAAGLSPYPAVLDDIIGDISAYTVQELPVQDLPVDRIVGVKSAGRIFAFTASFLPLLDLESEFATKWINLCADHLSDVGIRDPILCYEYLGDFYIQEGNKRLSVLKEFGAPKIPGAVRRVLPKNSDSPRIKAYYEFLDFYKDSKVYDIQFRRPGDYAKLIAALDQEPGREWTEWERRAFTSHYHYFKEAFMQLGGVKEGLMPEEALLLWLQVYSFKQIGEMSSKELKKSLAGLWGDVLVSAVPEKAKLETAAPADEGKGLLSKLITPAPEHLNVAFVYQRDPDQSPWTKGHERGRQYLERVMGDKVTVRCYYHADSPEQAEALLDKAVDEGAELVFSTTPQLLKPTLKAAVKYPKVRFLNCSAGTQLSSVHSYYCRVYEGKFVTGAIAGALAENDLIGYVGSYPILGVPASINAFALGAQMTNPRAKILLDWSCLPGNATESLIGKGARVISNRDIPVMDKRYLEHGQYGTYILDADGKLVPIASPCWLWGKLYENIVRAVLAGTWGQKKGGPEAVSYWWGMDSGVIDVELSDRVPESLRAMAKLLIRNMRSGQMDPFRRRILAQDGTEKNDGNQGFTPEELLHMDWLCENVVGSIPEYGELLPVSQPLVRELGLRDIPQEKESENRADG